jgi:hypothetical protein
MSLTRWFKEDGTPAELDSDDLRREERRLGIREEQAVARLQELLTVREEAFARGAATHSLALRRILARRFAGASTESQALETDILRIGKDLVTVRALLRLPASSGNGKARGIGARFADLQVAYEDDRTGEAAWRDGLFDAMGLTRPEKDPVAEVFRAWRALDAGEVPDVAAARHLLEPEGGEAAPATASRK